MLLQIYYKRLNNVCDAAEAFQIHVLVVPEHLCAGVSDEGKLVLVGGLDVLHQRGEGVSAAVRGVFPAIGSVEFDYWVINAAGFQGSVELLAVLLDCHRCSVRVAEDRAGDLPIGEPVDGGLDLRGNRNDTVAACFGFGAAGEVFGEGD